MTSTSPLPVWHLPRKMGTVQRTVFHHITQVIKPGQLVPAVPDLAKHFDLRPSRIETILHRLRKAGLLMPSPRGRKGGYVLTAPPYTYVTLPFKAL